MPQIMKHPDIRWYLVLLQIQDATYKWLNIFIIKEL